MHKEDFFVLESTNIGSILKNYSLYFHIFSLNVQTSHRLRELTDESLRIYL